MNPNITKLIDQYLSGELNAEDTAIFEARMANNLELRQEVELQQTIIDGAIRATDRLEVKKARKKYHYKKLLKWTSLSTIAVAIITAAALYIVTSLETSQNELPEITSELTAALDKKAAIENLDIQYFSIAKNGGVVLSEDGVLISVPEGAFMLNGKPYKEKVVVQFQEALEGIDIVKSGLSTMSGDRLLETQGMFGLAGYTADGRPLDINPKVGVYIQSPVNEYNEKMQLFDGVKKADGTIDWQNPEPLAKIPVSVDMAELDFYPDGYEDFLDAEKWKKSKKSRDSLYLSLEEVYYYESNTENSHEQKVEHQSAEPITIKDDGGGAYFSFGISDSIAVSEASMDVAAERAYFLSPFKVLAFWNKKFNNTNLATREFEKRVQVMHKKCFDADGILKKYTSQLNKPIWKIDEEVAAMGHDEFKEFAAEKIGVVNENNAHLKGLQDFYEKGLKKLRDQNRTYQNIEKDRQNKWNREIAKERSSENNRTVKRNADALDQEYNFNLRNVKKHFGKTVGFTIRHSPPRGPVIKNIDAYVYEATVKRQTTTIVDPASGKTMTITYNKFSLEVENADKYIKLFTYLFPNKIKSFQRIDGKGGKFSYPLNDDIIYDIAIVGITEKGYEYYQKMSIKGGELGKVKLKGLTEADLEASIKQLNGKRISKPININAELEWLVKERVDYKEQKMRKNMAAFRETAKCVIYPCYSCASGTLYDVEAPKNVIGQ